MTEVAHDLITESIPSLSEDEAFSVMHTLAKHFGWAGTMFCRGDAEQEWQNLQYDHASGLTPNDPMPDNVWTHIQNSWEWRKGIEELLCERGWELVSNAVEEALTATAKPDLSTLTCVECGRVFDMTNHVDAEEFTYGHDCEAQ